MNTYICTDRNLNNPAGFNSREQLAKRIKAGGQPVMGFMTSHGPDLSLNSGGYGSQVRGYYLRGGRGSLAEALAAYSHVKFKGSGFRVDFTRFPYGGKTMLLIHIGDALTYSRLPEQGLWQKTMSDETDLDVVSMIKRVISHDDYLASALGKAAIGASY